MIFFEAIFNLSGKPLSMFLHHRIMYQVKISLSDLRKTTHQIESPLLFILDKSQLLDQRPDIRRFTFQVLRIAPEWLEGVTHLHIVWLIIRHMPYCRELLHWLSTLHLIFGRVVDDAIAFSILLTWSYRPCPACAMPCSTPSAT